MKTIFFAVIMFFPLHIFAQIISPNMNMPVPVPGVTPGPDWATDIDASLSIIDSHDHSPGKGVQITPAGINISSDLTCNSNNITSIRASRYASQSAPLSTGSDLNETYVSGVDLYYNDGAGNQIRLTQGGSIVGTAGSISGLPSGTASASYAAGTYVFQSATSTPGNIDGGSFIFRNTTANSKGVTVSPINALGSNYSLFLPPLPSVQSIMTLDASGNMAAPYTVDGSSVTITANQIGVGISGVATTNLANQSVTAAKIANSTITGAQLAASQTISTNSAGQAITSNSFTNVTNLSATITTHGRPVLLMLQSGLTVQSEILSTLGGTGNIAFLRGGVQLNNMTINGDPSNAIFTPSSSLQFLDVVGAGTYTYTVQARTNGSSVNINHIALVAAEL